MFKRALLASVVVGMLSVPATADLVGDQVFNLPVKVLELRTDAGSGRAVGIATTVNGHFDTSYPTGYTQATTFIPAANGDVIVVTFAFYWPYGGPGISVDSLRTGLRWDRSEVTLIGASLAGPMTASNYRIPQTSLGAPATPAAALNAAAGAGTGIVQASGFSVAPATPFLMGGSPSAGTPNQFFQSHARFLPFLRATFSAVAPFPGDGLDIDHPQRQTLGGLNRFTSLFSFNPSANPANTQDARNVGALFHDIAASSAAHTAFSSSPTNIIITDTRTFITGGRGWNRTAGADLVPEPASAALLGIGALALTGGFWQRRRRQA